MELFLIYIWLKLSLLIFVLGIVATVTGGMFLASKMCITTKSFPEISFEKWMLTEDAKKLGADPTYQYTAKRTYEDHVTYVKTRTSDFPLPKWFVWMPVLSSFLFITIPDKTGAAVLVASSIAIDVAKSPEGTKIGQLLRGKANELLDAELKKLAPQPTK